MNTLTILESVARGDYQERLEHAEYRLGQYVREYGLTHTATHRQLARDVVRCRGDRDRAMQALTV